MFFLLMVRETPGSGCNVNSIEDLDNIRNDPSGNYVLCRDLDFEDPNSWDDYVNRHGMYNQSIFELFSLGRANLTEYQIPYYPISEGSVTVYVGNVERNKYENGVTGGWKIDDYGVGLMKFVDIDGNTRTPANLYGVETWRRVTADFSIETPVLTGWAPIGVVWESSFSGIFNGNGFVIGNLYIDRPHEDLVGLFGSADRAIIKNLGLTGVVNGGNDVGCLLGYGWGGSTLVDSYSVCEVSGYQAVGGLVGQMQLYPAFPETNIIENSYATGNVEGASYVGGLIGFIYNGYIYNSYATGEVIAQEYYGGGLVGNSNGYGLIINSYATGDVRGDWSGGFTGSNDMSIFNSYATGDVIGSEYIGGFTGENIDVIHPGIIENCYSTGSVTRLSGSNTRVGGFCGYNNRGTITKSYSTGRVYYEGATDPTDKGFVGTQDTRGNWADIDNFFDKDTSNQLTTAGNATPKTTAEMKDIATFSDTETVGLTNPWDIVLMNNFNPSEPSVWYIRQGEDYPRLLMEYPAPVIETRAATHVTLKSARLVGALTNLGEEDTVEISFQYRLPEQEWIDTPETEKTTTGEYTHNLSGLIPNTTYEYRSVVTWRDVGTVYGEIVSFSTLPLPTFPTTFGLIQSNISEISDKFNTEIELIFTLPGVSSIRFAPGLNLVDNFSQVLQIEDYVLMAYDSDLNLFRASVNTSVLTFLSDHNAVITFSNVSKNLNLPNLNSSNFRDLLYISVYNDSGILISNPFTYFDWDEVVYDETTDTLTLPVSHFSEYILSSVELEEYPFLADSLPQTGMSILPVLTLSLLFVSIYSRKRIY